MNLDQALAASLTESGFPGTKEVIDFSFYDSKTFVNTVAQTQTYFETPQNNLLVGNFKGAGAFPTGQAFAVTSLRIVLPAVVTPADAIAILGGISVTVMLDNAKKYAEGLVRDFPAGVGVTMQSMAASALTNGSAQNGIASLGAVKRFARPIVLRTQQPFSVTLQTAGITLGASTVIAVYLDGVFVRNVV